MSELEAAAADADSDGGGDSRSLVHDPAPHTLPACQGWVPVQRASDQPSLRLAAARLRAARGELLQQRGEFSLDVDHPLDFPQLSVQPSYLLAQPGDFALARVSWRST